jgi:hypothetical protein
VVTLDGTRAAFACACESFAERDHLQHLSHRYFHHCVECTMQRRRDGGAFFIASLGSTRGGICAPLF